MKSWRTVIFRLMTIVLLSMIAFALLSNMISYEQIRKTYQVENQQAIQSWSENVEMRLSSVREHLSDLILIVYNSGIELQSGTDKMPYMMQYALHDELTEKIMISEDASYFFIRDKESDLLLCANSAASVSQNVPVRNWLMDNLSDGNALSDKMWKIVQIGNEAYFIRTVVFGKYLIGAMCRLDNFPITEDRHVLGEEMACMLLYEDQLFYVGNAELKNPVELTKNGEPYTNDKNIYLSTCTLPTVNATGILAIRHISMGTILFSSVATLALMGGICIILLIMLFVNLQRMVTKPAEKILQAMEEIQSGNLDYRIESLNGSQEFDMLSNGLNNMVAQIQNLRIEAYDRIVQRQTDELMRMRAQLRPHFYLNAITTVSNMTYNNQNEDIRTYLSALAKYMRYMLQQQDEHVTIGQELENIQNYLQMQKIRFPGGVDAFIGCFPDAADIEIPYLILFTTVENVFKHALNPYRKLQLIIQCEKVLTENFSGCRITVEDNGDGFTPEVLANFTPGGAIPQPKDHLGLTNISRTLQLVYQRNDLLVLSNSPAQGARVELWIPEQKPSRPAESMWNNLTGGKNENTDL